MRALMGPGRVGGSPLGVVVVVVVVAAMVAVVSSSGSSSSSQGRGPGSGCGDEVQVDFIGLDSLRPTRQTR